MRHLKDKKRLGTHSSHSKAIARNLIKALITNGRIQTTLARAKAMRSMADKMVTLGKRNDLHARRQVYKVVSNRSLVSKLFNEIAPHFSNRQGGYTRVLKLGFRNGDNAPMARLEYILPAKKKVEKKEDTEKKAAKKAAKKVAKKSAAKEEKTKNMTKRKSKTKKS
ncbi:50S ribosomal protein L17 [bacterium]|nr:50S ribosomal protein L17 [bacterium]